MKNTYYSIFCTIAAFLCANLASAQTLYPMPENLSAHKNELIKYHDSGSYYHDISNVTQRALYYMKFRITQNNRLPNPKRLAVVFDIDETALSNYDDMRYLNFGGTRQESDALEAQAHDSAIPYTRTLYNYAKNNGINIFFVTGRPERMRHATVTNLLKEGYNHWTDLYMRPNKCLNSSVSPYKTAMRKKITNAGYDIIFNIGDQESDLAGGYADMVFKVPDPYYLIM